MIEEFLTLAFPEDDIIKVEEFNEGYNNVSYDVHTSSGNYVLKVLKLQPENKLVLKQNEIRRLLPQLPIAPVVFEGDGFVVFEKIEGKSFQEVYDKVNNKDEVFEQIGEVYGQMHSIQFDTYGFLRADFSLTQVYDDWQTDATEKISSMLDHVPKEIKERELNYFETRKHLLQYESSPVLVHGDSSLTNIIVKKVDDRWVLSGLIDFEFANSGGMVYGLFNGKKTFLKKFEHKDALARGHEKYATLPEHWQELAYFYYWLNLIQEFKRIPNMKWRHLNDEQTLQRREKNYQEAMNALSSLHNSKQ